jgi:hypothetical protein
LDENLADHNSGDDGDADIRRNPRDRGEAEEASPAISAERDRPLGQPGFQLGAGTVDRGEFGFEMPPVNSRKIGNCILDLCHPPTAIPARGEMGTNASGSAAWKFAVRGQKKFFVPGMKVFAQHSVQLPSVRSTGGNGVGPSLYIPSRGYLFKVFLGAAQSESICQKA